MKHLGKGRKLLVVVLTLIVCLFSSCRLFYADEPAPVLQIPSKEEITGVCVKTSLEVRTDEESIENAIAFLQSTVPTRYESVNDTPYAEPCYFFCLETTEGRMFRGFFYEEKSFLGLVSKWYFEMPYSGIYEVSEERALALLEE